MNAINTIIFTIITVHGYLIGINAFAEPPVIKTNKSLNKTYLGAVNKGSLLPSTDFIRNANDLNQFEKDILPDATITDNDIDLTARKVSLGEKLLQISNIASLLCIVDCTVFPLVTLLLSLTGPVSIGSSTCHSSLLHEIGHSVSIFFVLPVGLFATVLNFIAHGKRVVSSLAVVGLFLIYLANGHGAGLQMLASLFPNSHGFFHALHCGNIAHKICNIAGCILLLGSNYVSRKATNGCVVSGIVSNGIDAKENKSTKFSNVPGYGIYCNVLGCFCNTQGVNKNEEKAFFSWS